MASKTASFLGGVVGAALPYAAFYARHSDVIADVKGAHGTTGLAMAGAAGLGVGVVGGLLAAVVAPARWGVSLLLGVLVAAGVFVAGIPQFGKTTDGTRPKTEPVWVAVTPVSVAVDHAVRTAQGSAATERDQALQSAQQDADAELQKAMEKAQAAQVEAVAAAETALREAHAAALSAARAEADRARQAAIDAAQEAAREERDRMLAEANAQAEQERATLLARIEAMGAVAEERDRLRAAVIDLEKSLAAERGGRATATQELADVRQLVQWTEADGKSAKPLLRVLSAKITSKEAGERVVAARLLPMCGNAAVKLLTTAINDPDGAVAEAAKASLAKLSG